MKSTLNLLVKMIKITIIHTFQLLSVACNVQATMTQNVTQKPRQHRVLDRHTITAPLQQLR